MFGRYLATATARTSIRAVAPPLASITPTVVHRTLPVTTQAVTAVASSSSTTTANVSGGSWNVRQLHVATKVTSIPSLRGVTKMSSDLSSLRAMIPRRFVSKVNITPGEFQRLQALERDADGHPSSEAMQVRFYKALLPTMPGIIVQRYESGNFAGGSEADTYYQHALERVDEPDREHKTVTSSSTLYPQHHQPAASYGGTPYPHHPPQPSPYAYPPSYTAPAYGMPYGVSPPQASPYGYSSTPMYHHTPPPPQPSSSQSSDHHRHDDPRPELGSEARPLYMQPVPDKWARGFEAARVALSCFFMYYIYTLIYPDDKSESGSGGIPGLPGSAAGKAHREADISQTTTRFTDVKGCDEAKHELQEIVQFLRDPEKFAKLGAKLPRGVLLVGPPGTGKTLLAKAIAGEAGVPFFFASGSEFDEMYVGVGASRIKKLFAQARKKSPCIIFIDELDAIGGRRNPRDSTHSRQAINQLLVELDGFDTNDKVIVIGATNLASVLDKALLRPGRFDRHVDVPLPDVKGRKEILELYGKKVPLAPDANLLQLARGTPGSSGAELFNLINSAALRAAALNAKQITTHHLEWARDKILMGAERKSNIMPEAERRSTAYHEGGHAIIALKTKGAYPIHKATIMRRGDALGMVSQLPEQDITSLDREQMMAKIDICMGGRVAEELILGPDHITSGASNDLMQATNMARGMVLRYGMGRTTGLASISDDDLPKQSEETRQLVDTEVKQILDESYKRATAMMATNEAALHRLAAALLKHETLDAKEITTVVNGGTIDDSRFAAQEIEEREQRAIEREAAAAERAKLAAGLPPITGLVAPTPLPTPLPAAATTATQTTPVSPTASKPATTTKASSSAVAAPTPAKTSSSSSSAH